MTATTDVTPPPPLTARERQRRTSWRAIQAAALTLVRRDGFDRVTVEAIAERAGVSRRTFFNHFPTKAAALFDPDPDDADRLRLLLDAAAGTPRPWEALRAAMVEFVAGHDAVIAVRRELVATPELARYHRTAHHHVEVALAAWARSQLASPFEAAVVSQTAASILTASFTAWSADGDPAELPRLVGRGFDLVADGFASLLRHPQGRTDT